VRSKRGRSIAPLSGSIGQVRRSSRLHSILCFSSLALCGLAAALLLAGCSQKSQPQSELRGVTREIVASAQKITAHKSAITIRPEVHSAASGASKFPATVEHIYISLPETAEVHAFEQSLSEIAHRHKLSLTEKMSAGVMVADFVLRGTVTHSVHIVTPIAAPYARSPSRVPRLAIILDDLGYDRVAADSLLALPFPVTVSVIPHLPLSSEIAEEAFRHGDEVLLHLPMQSESADVKHEDTELRVGMNAQEVDSAVAAMLNTVPHAVGVNNHQGSRATADPVLMQELMPALRERGLFFVDSRTTTATVAYDAAEQAGVPAASRKVFLDDTPTKGAVEAELDLAARAAARDGFAIAIGHPHPATIAALAEAVPRIEAHGVRLVFASEVVR
jgi:polysaccharide deacetylase 2 family uncharacterized protein YibQ